MASFGTAFKNGLFFTLFGIVPIALVTYLEVIKQYFYIAPMFRDTPNYTPATLTTYVILLSVLQFVIVGLVLGTLLFKYISDTVEAGLTYE